MASSIQEANSKTPSVGSATARKKPVQPPSVLKGEPGVVGILGSVGLLKPIDFCVSLVFFCRWEGGGRGESREMLH